MTILPPALQDVNNKVGATKLTFVLVVATAGRRHAVRADTGRLGPTDEERTFHSFRHNYGPIAMEIGVQLKWLQKQLGHVTFAMTADSTSTSATRPRNSKLRGAFNV